MRFRFLLLPLALTAAAACADEDGVSVNARPPLGGVRFINAVPDGGPVDIRMIDQVEWSASSVVNATTYGLPFRAGTIHWPTEAKARHIRVFPTDSSIAVTSQVLHDTTITIEADKNVTLMLVGSRVADNLHFVMIDDTPAAMTGQQVAVRLVNAVQPGGTPGSADGYVLASTGTALPGSATFSNVGPLGTSNYVVRDTGAFAVRVTPASNTAAVWSAAAPAGAPATSLIGATAGATGAGSGLSAYIFPASVAGAPGAPAHTNPTTGAATPFANPVVIFFVDRVPPPPTQ